MCRTLRANERWAPIIVVTARDGVDDRVVLLDPGADDYVTKPIVFEELLARIRAVVRRGKPPRPTTLGCGDLALNRAGRVTSASGQLARRPMIASRKPGFRTETVRTQDERRRVGVLVVRRGATTLLLASALDDRDDALGQLVEDTVESFRARATDSGVAVAAHIAATGRMSLDTVRIRQALTVLSRTIPHTALETSSDVKEGATVMSNRIHPRNRVRHPLSRIAGVGVAAALVAAPMIGHVPAASAAGRSRTTASVPRGRVDTVVPAFSHPTRITNPLFPITTTKHMIALGEEGDTRLRQETTLLDHTRTISLNGQNVEAVVSQFVAYGDEQIIETAIDYFAQADDGSVWYCGEDVTNYEGGAIRDHKGTWLAGKDGPPGMIMPANSKVGDVYRPENIPGVVFEETTVKAVGLTVDGPSGPIRDAIRVEEHPADGDVETKVYAPGYGEFEATVPAAAEHVVSAIAVPTDVVGEKEPDALDSLSDSARDLLDGAESDRWSKLRREVKDIDQSWKQLTADGVPATLETEMQRAVDGLHEAVIARDRAALAQASLDAEFAAMDSELQYTDRAEVDHDRIESWQSQRRLHKATGDTAGVASDRIIIGAIKDRPKR